jgi:pimeloyl-ACP methyl ester carboxylesterase
MRRLVFIAPVALLVSVLFFGLRKPPRPTIAWDECPGSCECGRLEVPIDYERPDGPTFTLQLIRHRAATPERHIGVLVSNPGGPGGTSVQDFPAFVSRLSWSNPRLYHQFDLVTFDWRGIGYSSPRHACRRSIRRCSRS